MKSISVLILLFCVACSPTSEKKSDDPVNINNENNANNGNNANNENNANNATDMGTDQSVELDFEIDEDGPQFVDVAVSPRGMSEGESVTVLVQITDPQGFDDIGGGRILDLADNVYGNFSGSGGSYQADLTWFQINDIEPITFTNGATLTLIAEFFDGDGHVSKQSFSVELDCDGATACDGACGAELCANECLSEFITDENCGSCGNTCNNGEFCDGTQCVEPGDYLSLCRNDSECSPMADCSEFFINQPTCNQFCEIDDDCPGGICVFGEACAIDCSNDPNGCPNGMSCQNFEGTNICIPALD